jgi:hypothetical protein
MKLKEIAKIIRSKNAGPFYCTFDIIFKDYSDLDMVLKQNLITPESISKMYNLPTSKIKIFEYKPAFAIKITIPRLVPSGDIEDTDIYGAQQHAPLLDISVQK